MLISVPFTVWVMVPRGLRRPGCARAKQAPNATKARSDALVILSEAKDDKRSFLAHVRVFVIGGRGEGLLDRARADPTHEVQLRARLVVRPRAPSAPERLLTDDGARRLVVDVEVSRRVAERHHRFANRASLCGEHLSHHRHGAGALLGP